MFKSSVHCCSSSGDDYIKTRTHPNRTVQENNIHKNVVLMLNNVYCIPNCIWYVFAKEDGHSCRCNRSWPLCHQKKRDYCKSVSLVSFSNMPICHIRCHKITGLSRWQQEFENLYSWKHIFNIFISMLICESKCIRMYFKMSVPWYSSLPPSFPPSIPPFPPSLPVSLPPLLPYIFPPLPPSLLASLWNKHDIIQHWAVFHYGNSLLLCTTKLMIYPDQS